MCTTSPCWQCQELRDDYYNARLDEANAEIKHQEMKIIKGILDAGCDPDQKVWWIVVNDSFNIKSNRELANTNAFETIAANLEETNKILFELVSVLCVIEERLR